MSLRYIVTFISIRNLGYDGGKILTSSAQCNLLLAEEALRLNHNYIGIEHLLFGLIREGEGLAIKVLHSLDVDPVVIRRAVERAVAIIVHH